MAPEGKERINSVIYTTNTDCCTTTDFVNNRIEELNEERIKDRDAIFESLDRIEDKVSEIKNPVMYMFVNKGLNMNAGKVAAQVAHAQEELFTELRHMGGEAWEHHLNCMAQNPRTVIVLEVQDTDELYKVNSYLESCDITTGIYVDEGSATGDYMLEPTAIACEYLDKADERTQLIFRMFKLYENQPDLQPHFEKACSILEHLSYLACHPKRTAFGCERFTPIDRTVFRREILEDVSEWDEYAYKHDLLKYIKPKAKDETE